MPRIYEEEEEPAVRVKLPRGTPASYADLLYATREERYRLQREISKKKGLEAALTEFFVNSLSKDSTGVSGRVATVQVYPTTKPVVEDWTKFYAHVLKTKSFDLLQRRLNEKAVSSRWADKKQVPGVGKFNAKKVSCTSIKKR